MDLVEARQIGFAAAARHPWELARFDAVRSLIARHVTLPAGAVVLDVGCGDTYVVERLAAAHPDALFYAIDPALTDELTAFYRARLRAPNVFVGSSLDTLAAPPDTGAALVLLMDVLEHIADDRAFLADFLNRPAIGADARVIVTVPAFQSLFCSHDRMLGHYRRYSSRQLRRVLEGSGLSVIDSGSLFFSLLPVRAVQVIRERLSGAAEPDATGLSTWKGGPATTSLLRRLLLLDSQAAALVQRLGVTVPGLSHYAVCRKSA